jgi:hypothetical protein
MLERVRAGDFYVLCPDNEARPAVDALRIMWAAGGAPPPPPRARELACADARAQTSRRTGRR